MGGEWRPSPGPLAHNSYRFCRKYTVALLETSSTGPETVADQDSLIVARRSVHTCIKRDDDGCLHAEQKDLDKKPSFTDLDLFDLDRLPPHFSSSHVIRELRERFTRAQSKLEGVSSLLETNFVTRRLAKFLPQERMARPAAEADTPNNPMHVRLSTATSMRVEHLRLARLTEPPTDHLALEIGGSRAGASEGGSGFKAKVPSLKGRAGPAKRRRVGASRTTPSSVNDG